MLKRVTVEHERAGYRAYLDETHIPKPNGKAIFIIVMSLFGAGALCTALTTWGTFAYFNPAVTATPTADAVAQLDVLLTARGDQVLSPPDLSPSPVTETEIVPTFAPSPTPPAGVTFYTAEQGATLQAQFELTKQARPTSTEAPMIPTLNMTATYEYIATQYVPILPSPTATQISLGRAVVVVDRAIIRASTGTQYRALGAVSRGHVLTVRGYYGASWVQVSYDGHDNAWIASHLVRIESP